MNQHNEAQDLTGKPAEYLEYSEMVNDLDYGQDEIKPFQLDALFREIEQLLLSPAHLAGVSLVV